MADRGITEQPSLFDALLEPLQLEPLPPEPAPEPPPTGEAEPDRTPAADQAARDAIRTRLDETLFVEAGAGTGKTTALVGRIVELVATGRAEMRGIAAITFTEAAAAELRDRIRQELEKAAHDGRITSTDDSDPVAEVDEAAISTLHAFAQRILAEHPLEAGLPPAFDVLDEIQSGLAFDERWQVFVDELLDDESLQPVILRGLATGLTLDALEEVARAFHDHWDRLEEVTLTADPLDDIDATAVVEALRDAHAQQHQCSDDTDRLLTFLGDWSARADRLQQASELEVLNVLAGGGSWDAGKRGRKENWLDKDAVIGACARAQAARIALLDRTRQQVLAHLLVRLQRFTLDSAEERRRQGRLEFHDLLVLARRVLHDNEDVRRALKQRFSHLLIDEFQDTDPIQVELAELLGGGEPGRLFFVGDAKQSIYRFRRASIETFERTKRALGDSAAGTAELALTQNFRSVPGVLEWVNHTFGGMMGEGVTDAQPAYEALAPAPDRVPLQSEPPVALLGRTYPKQPRIAIARVREIEARELALTIRDIEERQWPVFDTKTGEVRGARLADVAILLPARTSLPQLEAALEDAQIAYRVQSSSLVWGTQEVRDLLAVLAAVDDPTNEVALVAALRAPAFACGDDDLLAWRQAGGRWNLRAPCPESLPADHPVCAAVAVLRDLHDRRWWLGVSGMVEEVARELRFFELAFAHHRPRDYWRRLRFVIDQARAFEEGGAHVTLRDFVSWAERQGADDARVKESVLPEADDDAVRIFTIHGAKGLEFPICVLSGLNRSKEVYRNVVVYWREDGVPEVKMGRFRTVGFGEVEERERRMNLFEEDRLLYVGATRARDHLIISVHHKEGDNSAAARFVRWCDEATGLWRALGEPILAERPPAPAPPRASGTETEEREEWAASRSRLIETGRSSGVISATALAKLASANEDGSESDDEIEADLERPWRRGRGGTALGRAVHGALQTVDLATAEGLAPIAAAQAAAEGIPDRAGEIERLARVALDTDVVKEAIKGRHWRELYVCAPVDGQLVEGFVDLLYEGPDGLVIVDWKTDAARGDAAVEALVARYRPQLAAYARVLSSSLGTPVTAATLVIPSAESVVRLDVGTGSG